MPSIRIPKLARERIKDIADRAVVTAAEGALLSLGQDAVSSGALDIRIIDWPQMGSFALGGAFLSVVINFARNGLRARREGKPTGG